MTTLTLLGIYVIIAWLWIARKIYINVRSNREPERMLVPIENGREVLAEGTHNRELRIWAEANGFEPDSMFDFFGKAGPKRLTLSIWINPEKQVGLGAIEVPGKGVMMTEFSANFEGDVELVTSGSRASLFFPNRPGRYVQAFKNRDLDNLLREHEHAIGHLREKLNVGKQLPETVDYEEMLNDLRRMGAYIESLPLWPLRAPYWFFFRQYYYFNKSIARRYPA